MESDDDFDQFSPLEESSSPAPDRKKLKRLKKAKTVEDNAPKFETLDIENPNHRSQDFEEPNLRSTLHLERSESEEENELELDTGFKFDTSRTKRLLEFDDSVAEEIERDGEETRDDVEIEEETGDLDAEKLEKKRRSFDENEGSEENKKKKKKKKKKRAESVGGVDDDDDDYEKPKSTATNKRRVEKERREHLIQLRAESQRLLRETRDATFKPMALVQKPISSLLEKIRQRKQEVSKKSVMLNKTSFITDYDDELLMEAEPKIAHDDEIEDYAVAKAAMDGITARPIDVVNDLDIPSAADETANQSNHESFLSPVGPTGMSKQAFWPPVDDTQDLFFDSHKDELQEETPKSPREEVLAPSLLAMNLKFESAPPEDILSDGEDDDKENINPHRPGSVDLSLSPNGDPVKAFVDDEAEEEDDSDNDLLRFKDIDEDEDDEDFEELKDMIATGYQEKPIDSEKRNELHQKWLELQDAAGTEKVLQRLKCGVKQMETTLLEEEEDQTGEDDDDELDNEDAEDLVPTNIVQINLRKAKQMISQMFTDKNDAYISSDDEETETRHVNRGLFEKHSETTKHISPAKEEQSRNVVIKKMNAAPDTREKAKRSSLSNMRFLGGNKNVSTSKPSFLGRGSHHSLPSSHRHGSGKGRPFIFERDDSNSRSAASQPEESSDLMQREDRPTRTASAKYSYSQSQFTTQMTKAAVEMNSGPSLHEILRRSSWQSSHCIQDSTVCHTEAVFAAFKLEKKPLKKEPGVSVRSG